MAAFAFAARTDRLIAALPNDSYLRRVGRAKQLLEEVLPLSRLALSLKLPGLRVLVTAHENDGPVDGRIEVSGFITRDFDVEVTYASYGQEEALRSELLSRSGFAPAAGPISRAKSGEIVATMGAIDCDEHINRLCSATMARFKSKSEKAYATKPVLLIAFDEVKLFGVANWSGLFAAIAKAGGMRSSSFQEVHLFNGATNETHRVWSDACAS